MNNENNIVKLKDQPTNQKQDENLKPSTRRLSGKVAALPKHLRDLVNSMLDDGNGYETIVAKLDELGHPGFLTQNISRWKLNGYQQYLRRQEHLDEIKIRSESALDFLHHFVPSAQLPVTSCEFPFTNSATTSERVHTPTNGLPDSSNLRSKIQNLNSADPNLAHLHYATEAMFSFQLFETLLETTQCDLSLEQKTKLLYQLGRLINSNMRERTRRDQHALDTRKYDDHRADLQAPPAEQIEPDHELTQAQTRSIVHKVDRLFGIKLKIPKDDERTTSSPSPLNGERAGVRGETPPLVSVSSEPERTPTNASTQLSVTNSVEFSNSVERDQTSSHANPTSLPNPNPIGAWPQPDGTIPVINVLGCIVGWAAHPEIPHAPDLTLRDPAANKAAPINCHGKTILWYNRNAQVRDCPSQYPIPGQPHFIPVMNSNGTVIDWREWDDEWFSDLPARNPRPLLTDGWRGQIIAWIDETKA